MLQSPAKRPKIEEIIPANSTHIRFEELCQRRYNSLLGNANGQNEAALEGMQAELLAFVRSCTITEITIDSSIDTNKFGICPLWEIIFVAAQQNESWAIHFLKRHITEKLLDRFRVILTGRFQGNPGNPGNPADPGKLLRFLVSMAAQTGIGRAFLLALETRPWSNEIQWHISRWEGNAKYEPPLLMIANLAAKGAEWPHRILIGRLLQPGPIDDRYDAMDHRQIISPLLASEHTKMLVPVLGLVRPDLRIHDLFKNNPLLQVAARAMEAFKLLTLLKPVTEYQAISFQYLPLDVRNIIIEYVLKNIYQAACGTSSEWHQSTFIKALNFYRTARRSLYSLLLANRGQSSHEASSSRIQYAIGHSTLETLRELQPNSATLLWLIAEANDVRLWLTVWEIFKDTLTFGDLVSKPRASHFKKGHKTILELLLDACADNHPQKGLMQACLLEIANKFSYLELFMRVPCNSATDKYSVMRQNSFAFNLFFPMFKEIVPLSYWLQLHPDLINGPLIFCLLDSRYEKVCAELLSGLYEAPLMTLLQFKFTTEEGETNGLYKLCQKASALPALFSDVWQRIRPSIKLEHLKSFRKSNIRIIDQKENLNVPVFFLLLEHGRKEELDAIVTKLSDEELTMLLKEFYKLDEKYQPTGIYLLFERADKYPQLVLDIWNRIGKLITLADLRLLPNASQNAALLHLARTAVSYPKLMQAVLATLKNQLELVDLRLRSNLKKGVLIVLFYLAKACDNPDPVLQECAKENFLSLLKQFSHLILIDTFTCRIENESIIQVLEKFKLYTLRDQILSQVSGILEEKEYRTEYKKNVPHQRDKLEPLIKARNALEKALNEIKEDPTRLIARKEQLKQLAEIAHQTGFLHAWLDVGQCFLVSNLKDEAIAALKRVPPQAWQYLNSQQQVEKLTNHLPEAALAVGIGAPAVIYSKNKRMEDEVPEKVTGKRYFKKPK